MSNWTPNKQLHDSRGCVSVRNGFLQRYCRLSCVVWGKHWRHDSPGTRL